MRATSTSTRWCFHPASSRPDDPLLSPRSAVYAASYRVRTREAKSSSAVDVDAVGP